LHSHDLENRAQLQLQPKQLFGKFFHFSGVNYGYYCFVYLFLLLKDKNPSHPNCSGSPGSFPTGSDAKQTAISSLNGVQVHEMPWNPDKHPVFHAR
jgi:hypothetical protein